MVDSLLNDNLCCLDRCAIVSDCIRKQGHGTRHVQIYTTPSDTHQIRLERFMFDQQKHAERESNKDRSSDTVDDTAPTCVEVAWDDSSHVASYI
jgi:hypothetical protein